jgi:hypothetical protein
MFFVVEIPFQNGKGGRVAALFEFKFLSLAYRQAPEIAEQTSRYQLNRSANWNCRAS